jgi:hypothetical protein
MTKLQSGATKASTKRGTKAQVKAHRMNQIQSGATKASTKRGTKGAAKDD